MVNWRNKSMGRVTVDLKVANKKDRHLAESGFKPLEEVRQTTIKGIVDTSVTLPVLPEILAQQLGLSKTDEALVHYRDQQTVNRDIVGYLEVEILGRRSTFNAIVEPDRTDALIGAIVLEALDMIVDCRTQTLHPRDPNHIIAEIE
jgi:hypothetical protein